MKNSQYRPRGPGLVEYVVIVVLIAVAAISLTQLFGASIRHQLSGMTPNANGKTGSAASKPGVANEKPLAGSTVVPDRSAPATLKSDP